MGSVGQSSVAARAWFPQSQLSSLSLWFGCFDCELNSLKPAPCAPRPAPAPRTAPRAPRIAPAPPAHRLSVAVHSSWRPGCERRPHHHAVPRNIKETSERRKRPEVADRSLVAAVQSRQTRADPHSPRRPREIDPIVGEGPFRSSPPCNRPAASVRNPADRDDRKSAFRVMLPADRPNRRLVTNQSGECEVRAMLCSRPVANS